jgi:hypothetical protein
MTLGKFFLSMLSEPDGTVSYSRVTGALMVFAVIFWGSYVVIKTHIMPDLGAATGLTSAGYIANKISGMLRKEDPKPEE